MTNCVVAIDINKKNQYGYQIKNIGHSATVTYVRMNMDTYVYEI